MKRRSAPSPPACPEVGHWRFLAWLLVVALVAAAPVTAQESAEDARGEETEAPETPPLPPGATLIVEPAELTIEVGEKATVTARIMDGDDEIMGRKIMFYSRNRSSVGANPAGDLEAYRPGKFIVVALVPKDVRDVPRRADVLLKAEIEVTVPNPPVATVEVVDLPGRIYAHTTVPLSTEVVDISGAVRVDVEVDFTSETPEIGGVDEAGYLTLLGPGPITVTARAENATTSVTLEVEPNPIETFELVASDDEVETGDVIKLTAIGRDDDGNVVEHLPVQFAVSGHTSPTILASGAAATVESDGTFVSERSGTYSVIATAGPFTAVERIKVAPRKIRKKMVEVGHAPVRDRHTSDLWVWEGADGRDYCITGTWGAEGHAYIWDVTNPESMVLIDTVRVDARTVNDVKLSEDGKIAVISREGASNRKNGIVILDVSEPDVGVRVLSRFDDQLKGGVHNVFVHENHVYAVNNGRRFDVINIEDPTQPHRVGRFELDTPGHGIHDVWVVDGIAFSSNWTDGVVAIDVGGAGRGGSPNNPVLLGSYAHPSGWNHAAFPYRSQSTGKFYVFAGDEAFPYGELGRTKDAAPPRAAGWIHVIEWDDWENPREVARYQVPEAGTHNLWIEDDILYVAYYNGGLRAVDVSGELRGDLYRQGREIGMWLPYDPDGFVPNAPFSWGPQPYKGHVFLSDWNSGLWAIKMAPLDDPDEIIGEPQ